MRQWSQRASDRTGSVLLCAVWVGGSVSVYGDGSTHTAHTQPLRFCPSDCPTCHGYLVENALHYLYSVVIYMDGWVSLVSGVQVAGTRLVYLGIPMCVIDGCTCRYYSHLMFGMTFSRHLPFQVCCIR